MDDRLAQGFVLTIHLSTAYLPSDVAEVVLADLAHLSAVRGPSRAGELTITCLVSAPTESEAVRYGAQRTITAMLGAGVDGPRVVSVDVSNLEQALV